MSATLPPHPDPLRMSFLQLVRSYPAVSVLVSLDGDEHAARARISALISEAEDRLRADRRGGSGGMLIDALRRLAEENAGATSAQALALYVSAGIAHAVHLPVGVRDRVVIDETFATRDLVHARARSARYRVLAVGDRRCRLYEGLGGVLDEVHDGGFPLHLPQPDEPQRPDRIRHQRNGRRDQQLRLTVQAVDTALTAHLRDNPTPLIVVGADRRVASVRDASRHRHLISAAVTRPADRLSASALAQLVAPHVEAMLAREQAEAMGALDDARGARRYASGIHEVWPLAAHGRAALLVAEHGFAFPARVDPVTDAVEPADDVEAPDVLDDLVDEAIEAVMAARGRVVIVPDGTLGDAEGIAMVVRW